MKHCIECNLAEGRFAVAIDSQGICNYCRCWHENQAAFTDYASLQPLFIERVEKLRGKYEYDALAGFSGGKDSTYVVNSLAKRHGLKVLTMTYDNGFLTDWARHNIETVVKALGVDHFFYKPNWQKHRAVYRAALETYGDPCVACAIPGYFSLIKTAFERRIPLLVHGRSPFQIFRNFYQGSADVFLELHESNYRPHSFAALTQIYRMLDDSARGWLAAMFPDDVDLRETIYHEFFPAPGQMDGTFAPDFVGLFQYESYDEERIKQEMEKATGYRRPAKDELLGHGDCAIHDACGYLFQRIHGASSTEVEIAAMLRHGVLTWEAAADLLASKNKQEQARPDVSIESLCRAVGLKDAEFEPIANDLACRIEQKFPCH